MLQGACRLALRWWIIVIDRLSGFGICLTLLVTLLVRRLAVLRSARLVARGYHARGYKALPCSAYLYCVRLLAVSSHILALDEFMPQNLSDAFWWRGIAPCLRSAHSDFHPSVPYSLDTEKKYLSQYTSSERARLKRSAHHLQFLAVIMVGSTFSGVLQW